MKKLIACIIVIILSISLCSCGAKNSPGNTPDNGQEEKSVTVYVTVSTAGELVLINKPVTVEDINNDGVYNLDEAIACAHKQYSDSEHDFITENSSYGLGIVRLWGVENGGSYGYFVNNVSAMSLDDAVSENDYIAVYSFADLDSWSDMYSWFDKMEVSGNEVSLKLTAAGFDSEWNPIDVPVPNAYITIDGSKIDAVTNEDGIVNLVLPDVSLHVISAVCDELTIVPPVCIANAK